MMVFDRMKNLVLASIHEGLDKLEDPEMMLNQYIRNVQSEMGRAEKAIEEQKKLHVSLERDLEEAKRLMKRREEQAKAALSAGEEELAKKALYSKKNAAEQVARYEALMQKSHDHVLELRLQLEDLEKKYEQLRDKKRELLLRSQSIKAFEQMKKARATFSTEGSERQFQRMEEKIEDMELRESAREGRRGFSVDYDEQVEQEFLNMKKSLVDTKNASEQAQ
ncbi:PspA/IM30 family protein [Halalkalibacterium halodurans]|nr:PspA/IM30 family protein [Halalkalibacterium halodurans]MDY7221720.1 PspA/IM30 family protein [Halalkalibacterium halodurans]MDY7240996.1 PspA/IM30 family protein [Halalkalibacterium halodurans]MED4173505.1 PspA/IM30 family protein [Halalkalibacterium halodurans]